jgi:nitrilase
MSILRVAVVQVSPGCDVTANLARAAELVAEAAAKGARLVVLPEMFAGVVPAERWGEIAETEGGPVESGLVHLSRLHHVWLTAGVGVQTRPQDPTGRRTYNVCTTTDPRGEIVARYRKMHLFWTDIPGATRYDERSHLCAGDCQTVVDIEGFRTAVGICYDLRFPEFFRKPLGAPADLYCLGAAFMKATGQAHWETLVRARAIENLSYFAAAGTWGRHYEVAGRPGEWVETYGHSMIVSPWGEVLAQVGEGEGVAVAEISHERIAEARKRLGALDHMREELWPRGH